MQSPPHTEADADTPRGTGNGDDGPTLWHLCWQAAVGRGCFAHPAVCGRIRERLIRAHQARGRVLLDYVVLPGEIHVLAQLPPGEAAGDLARAVGNVVSRWVRQVQPVRSPVLAGPHLAYRIGSVAELRNDVRMLAWRPVRLDVCKVPSRHAHGALRIALGLTPVQGFDSRWLLRLFGETVPQARAALRSWVARRPNERAWLEWELTRGVSLVAGGLGSGGPPAPASAAVHGAGAAVLLAAGAGGVQGALALLARWVAGRVGLLDGAALQQGTDTRSARARALVACLAVRHRLCSAASVARYFGRAKATLSEQMSACRLRPGDRAILATPARRIADEARALVAREVPAGRKPGSPS